jgi:hypothetical protein
MSSLDPVPTGPSAALRLSVPLLGALRLGFGGGAAFRPRQVAAGVGVSDGQVGAAVPYVRALAVRELALGIGAALAYRRGRSCAVWIGAMAVSDAFDAIVYELLAELGTLDRRRARRATLFALSGAVPEALTSVALARATREPHL